MSEQTKPDKTYCDWNMQMWLGQQSYERGLYSVAQQKFHKSLRDLESLHINDERLAMTLNNLALCYCAQGKHKDSDPLYQRALSIDQSSGKSGRLNLAEDFSNIATHYRKQGLSSQAEPLYQKALQIWQEELGDSSAEVAGCLNNLGVLYCEQHKCHEAIDLYKRALSIKGSIYGSKSKEYAASLVNLAAAYCSLNRCDEADPLFEEGIRTLEYTVDPVHEELLDALESYVVHLEKVGKSEQAMAIQHNVEKFRARRK
ncbi:MAG: tetratricopeptide repeat protein [Candidatus Melainabacteria bacterium]|nr:tetratricopeptide repeat protein [Candidatus Melainabacteria bacterium]